MRKRFTLCVLLFPVLLWLLSFSLQEASALPVFARKYQTSCTTCHAIIPKLNPFGIAFRNNGYRIPVNDEKFVKVEDVSLGAPAWKEVWPKAVWPGAIPGAPPFALRVLTDVNVRPILPVNVNFDFPHEFESYFAGTAGEGFSFFGEIEYVGSTNTISIQKGYGQFKLFGNDAGANWLTLKAGRMDTRVDPFSRSFRRTTSQHFGVSDFRAVSDGFRLRDRDAGVELWGAATGSNNQGGWEYAAGVVQGTEGKPENNNFKDLYFSLSYKFGGYGLVGSREEVETLAISDNYSEWSFLIGAFSYHGKAQPAIAGVTEDQLRRTGVKFDAYLKNLNLFGALVKGEDDLRGTSPRKIEVTSYFVEADYMLLPWIMPLIRIEKTNYSDTRPDVTQIIPAVNIAIRANIRLLVEGRLYNKPFSGSATRTGTNELRIRFDFVF